MGNEIKILQIGVGSMGKRRLRNLKYLGYTDISCWDIREDRRQEAQKLYGIKVIDSDDKIVWSDYTHAIISTPPDQHIPYAIIAISHGLHTFIEASVVDDGVEKLMKLSKERPDVVLAPSCTMRFDPLINKLKEIIDSGSQGKVLFVNHYFGQYLPNWHPYEDIHDFYVSKRETGAAREIVPFDLVYLEWIFGRVTEVTAIIRNTHALGANIEIDDIYSLLCSTDNGVQLHLTIDVLSRVPYRETKIICEKGNIEINNVKGELAIYNSDSETWNFYRKDKLNITYNTEEIYIMEINCFINATIRNEKFPYTMNEDVAILNTLYKAEQSFKERKHIDL